MPTYEYLCKACDAELEVVQSFTDDSLTTCEACGGELRKVFAAPGISFKGSGFYKTDSRNGSSAGKDGSSESSDAGSGDTKGSKDSKDSKPSANKKDATPKKDSTADKGSKSTKAPAAASSTS